MSYRAAPRSRARFERALRFAFTRVRLRSDRVTLDAPDSMGLLGIGMVAGLGVGALIALGAPGLLLSIAALLTARLHLRVRPGRVLLVRTILLVPWWISARKVEPGMQEASWWTECDWDTGKVLLLLRHPADRERDTVLLLEGFHAVTAEEIDEIARAAACVAADR